MKIPKFLTAITSVLICAIFIRAANGSSGISLYAILLKLQEFDFDITPITKIIKFYQESNLLHPFQDWNHNLTGITGFLTNLQNYLTGYLNAIINSFIVVIDGIWMFIEEICRVISLLFEIATYIFGIKI